jgi:hypothetical protein
MRVAIIVAAVASMAIGSALAQNANPSANPPLPATRGEPAPPLPPSSTPPADPGKQALPRVGLPPTEPGPPAVKTTEGNNPGAPVEGANSFTEGQAKSRIEARGFTNVGALAKDDKGIWRGTAMRDGKAVQVSLDFQGNVVAD